MADDRGPHASKLDKVMPPCPECGRKDYWYNDIPLHGYCWGTDDKKHREVKILVPAPHNPYLPPSDPQEPPIAILEILPSCPMCGNDVRSLTECNLCGQEMCPSCNGDHDCSGLNL